MFRFVICFNYTLLAVIEYERLNAVRRHSFGVACVKKM